MRDCFGVGKDLGLSSAPNTTPSSLLPTLAYRDGYKAHNFIYDC